ncbi:MAG TPA: hypothetical protein VJB69_03330 [Candidatus Paceibacterota bacterium]
MTKKEIADILKPYNEDIKRHMVALMEDVVKSDLQIIKTAVEPHVAHLEANAVR